MFTGLGFTIVVMFLWWAVSHCSNPRHPLCPTQHLSIEHEQETQSCWDVIVPQTTGWFTFNPIKIIMNIITLRLKTLTLSVHHEGRLNRESLRAITSCVIKNRQAVLYVEDEAYLRYIIEHINYHPLSLFNVKNTIAMIFHKKALYLHNCFHPFSCKGELHNICNGIKATDILKHCSNL